MYTIEALLDKSNNINKYFEKMFWYKFKMQNILISFAIKQMDLLERDKEYKSLKKDYALYINDKTYKKELKETKEKLSLKIKHYHLTKSDLEQYVKKQQYKYKKYISSGEAQAIALNVYTSIDKYLYKDGKRIHHKRLDDIESISAKSLTNGIKLDLTHNYCIFNKNIHCKFIIKDYNSYLRDCFNKDKLNIKYCRLIRKPFNNGYRYYIQFVIDSTPILKLEKGKGKCGIDPGVSSIAVTTNSCCMLEDLAPNINIYNSKIISIQKQMERSRKINNSNCYNEDGTIKKGSKFKKSKTYKHLNMLYKALNRKRTCYVKQYQEMLCNKIITKSNKIFYEDMNFKALAKRAKETKRQDKTSIVKNSKGEEKKVKKYKKKKRFGKMLKNKSPSRFLTTLQNKCGFYEIECIPINTKEFKASMYNHIFDDYRKKNLSDRWNILYDKDFNEILIQRDLYSSFLIKNSNDTLTHPNRDKCLEEFDNFIKLHNTCIKEVLRTNNNRLSCFGF